MVRVATWNICRSMSPDHIATIASPDVDAYILCAQEVTVGAYKALQAQRIFDWSVLSLVHVPNLPTDESSARGLGCAVFGRGSLLRRSFVLDTMPWPEKLIIAEVDLPGVDEPVHIASYHAAPSSPKARSTLAVAHWAEARLDAPTILGMDANSPYRDSLDWANTQYCWQQSPYTACEPALLGEHPRHQLRDAVRVALTKNPERQIADPAAPLGVTYNSAKNAGGWSPRRVDHVYVSRHFDVLEARSTWKPGETQSNNGSDHWLVWADLKIVTPDAGAFRSKGENVVPYLVRSGLIRDDTRFEFRNHAAGKPAGDKLAAWFAETPTARIATWRNQHKPLCWSLDGKAYDPVELLREIFTRAGAGEPSFHPPAHHWWVDEANGWTLDEHSAPSHLLR